MAATLMSGICNLKTIWSGGDVVGVIEGQYI